jgi:hypothetical protein
MIGMISGFAICFILITGLAVWCSTLQRKLNDLTRNLEATALVTESHVKFIASVKVNAERIKAESVQRRSELQARSLRGV